MNRTYVEIIAWNTGRQYTKHGQRIAAGRTKDQTIHFADIDRQIFGTLPATVSLSPDAIMSHYDRCAYEGDDIDATLMGCAAEV